MKRITLSLLIAFCCCLPSVLYAVTEQPIQVAWQFDPPSEPSLTGYKLYHNGNMACEINDPTATAMVCIALVEEGTINQFTLSALFADGSESAQSEPFPYTMIGAPPPELTAVITADATAGNVPFTVNLDSSSSIGNIADTAWLFGDGATANATTINYTYDIPGTYNISLTLTDTYGNISTDTLTITANAVDVPLTPPSAVISTSATTGDAALIVHFDGSASTTENTPIILYEWSFGDGTSATGASVNHTYTTPGNYTATLMVTDNAALTNETVTPIIVTAPPVVVNSPPEAVVSVSSLQGIAPLLTTFDGSASSDPDGSIDSYIWYFGDGTSANGASVSHTYASEGIYIATLQVTDDKGETATATTGITVNAASQTAPFQLELGEVALTGEWIRVDFSQAFTRPIVVAGPPGSNDPDPCVIRLRNIDSTGFEMKLDEWDYQDGIHGTETVSYFVMEQGRYTLNDGSEVEAGTFTGSTKAASVNYTRPFTLTPVVMTSIASVNESDTITSRVDDVDLTGFSYFIQEQEANKNVHLPETINYIAWEKGRGSMGNILYEIGTTDDIMTQKWTEIPFQNSFTRAPLFLADMQTVDGKETAALRTQMPTSATIQVRVEEEASKNSEEAHTTEVVGYIAIDVISEPTP